MGTPQLFHVVPAPGAETQKVCLEGRDLFRTFPRASEEALRVPDIGIFGGETVALVGDNGSGKTTFVSVLGLLMTPDRPPGLESEPFLRIGQHGFRLARGAWVPERPGGPSAEQVRRDDLACILQKAHVPPTLTASQVLRLVRGIRGLPIDEDKLVEWLELVGLPERYRDRYVSELSIGEGQRLAIAAALAKEPQIVLADEPTASLDVHARREFGELMAAWVRSGRKAPRAVVWASHQLTTVWDYADRIVALANGRILRSLRAADAPAARRREFVCEESGMPVSLDALIRITGGAA